MFTMYISRVNKACSTSNDHEHLEREASVLGTRRNVEQIDNDLVCQAQSRCPSSLSSTERRPRFWLSL